MEPKPPLVDTIATQVAQGAIYRPLHVERQVKIYPIQAHELTTLNMFSGITTIAAAIASAALGFMASVWWDMATAQTAATNRTGSAVLTVGGVVVVICIGVGIWAQWKKRSELAEIISESRVITP